MARPIPRLALFSGLGLDAGLYAPQRELPARLEFPDWLRADENESLRDYGHRLAKTIDPTPPLYLGGVSFGGMVALEVAAAMYPAPCGVFLIAACRSGRAVSPLVKLTCGLAQHLPDAAIRTALLASPLLLRMTGRADRRQRKLLLGLADRATPWLMRWGSRELLNWTAPPAVCPIYQIHGQDDLMIPLQNVRPDAIVPGGGHVINVTHAHAVNEFLAERMNDGCEH
jgi:pimeloyl-ACP methyl ester carboxylesterase